MSSSVPAATLDQVTAECYKLRDKAKAQEEKLKAQEDKFKVQEEKARAQEGRVLALEEIVVAIQRTARVTGGSSTAAAAAATVKASTAGAASPTLGLDDDDDSSVSPSDVGSLNRLVSGRVLTCLSRNIQRSVIAEQSAWFQALFPETCRYTLPVGAAKSGRAPTAGFDHILSELVRRSRLPSGSPRDAARYQAFAAEWPLLFQSVAYQIVQAEATSELLVFFNTLRSLPAEQLAETVTSSTLGSDLDQLLEIQCALLDDQTKRGSVIITAALKTLAGADLIANQFVSEVSGVHPSAEASYAASKPFSEPVSRPEAKSSGSGSRKWRGGQTSATASGAAAKTVGAPKAPVAAKRSKSPAPP